MSQGHPGLPAAKLETLWPYTSMFLILLTGSLRHSTSGPRTAENRETKLTDQAWIASDFYCNFLLAKLL